ncbi:hypothetical protein AVEN_172309-1 [Araneus ventricosus]|uniref:Uncharacterized protein n=1 Tax=Araneus ventricosus TaxID=182803 RepID=A0A4Y2E4J6_ARAVE|nr:hypothetical protein AVEN_172309-1 [Araneus ventricosus]
MSTKMTCIANGRFRKKQKRLSVATAEVQYHPRSNRAWRPVPRSSLPPSVSCRRQPCMCVRRGGVRERDRRFAFSTALPLPPRFVSVSSAPLCPSNERK